jgi:hypothetical protein
MMSRPGNTEIIDDGLLEQAFQLAYFILGDKELAEPVAAEAILRLDVAVAAQDRRYYYVPRAQLQPHVRARGVRTKVTLSELHLLQRLIYDEAEAHERVQEQATDAISDERLLVHFIKHLVRITLKRNSFYVTLGLSRLLYHYSTAEAMEIYNLVVQNPSRVKDDYYWRSRKGQLMQEMKERFGGLLAVNRAARGEERFVTRPDSSLYSSFVNDCLQKLMPWYTLCPLPAGKAAVSGLIPALDFHGADPDEEHHIEISRMHAVLHADCFTRLIAGLQLPPLLTRLELPRFFTPEGHNPPHTMQNPNSPSTATKSPHAHVLRAQLTEQQSLRRRLNPTRVRILVDRQQRATLDLSRTSQAGFHLTAGEEFIEVWSDQQEVTRLALYPVDYQWLQQTQGSTEFMIELVSGQRLKFALTPQRDEYDEVTGAAVMVSCAAVGWRAWQEVLRSFSPAPTATLQYGLASVLLLISLASGWWLRQALQPDTPTLTVISQPPTPNVLPTAASTPSTSPSLSVATPTPPMPRLTVNSAKKTVPTPQLRDVAPDNQTGVQSLAQAQQIFISLEGDDATTQALRAQLEQRLQATQRWKVASEEAADTALQVKITPSAATITAQLVNANGQVLWPSTGRARVYKSTPEEAAAQIVADLLAAAQSRKQ